MNSASGCHGVTLWVINPWRVPSSGGLTFPTINAQCGDQIQFVWESGSHGVFKLLRSVSGIGKAPMGVGGDEGATEVSMAISQGFRPLALIRASYSISLLFPIKQWHLHWSVSAWIKQIKMSSFKL